ncbi:DsbA family protein [Actinomadura alba]|uniref:Thioredoxin domain-containing protein n=1 Tax=Actinomadura alba TaxID=406431 RepID=A0ABR7LWH2_9ACTN|nr:thioredoxin domain-containing protein [Actinomadura alba]MBC6469202.1 thioredoxin domain-containing protein [Actinomadura alba]
MSKAARERTARDRLAEERKRQAERHKRLRAIMVTLGAIAVIAVVVVAFVAVQSNRDNTDGYQGPLAPLSRQADGSVVMAKAGVAGPVLEVFEDFQCPACKNFEDVNGDTAKRLAAEGKVKVIYRPFRLFQQEPLKSNSQRAANAAECAPADKWIALHDLIFKNQPAEGSKGFSNKDLIGWGKEAGINDAAFEKCVNQGEKNSVVDQATQYASSAGVQGTPTLNLNGTKLGDDATYTQAGLEKAIQAAASAPAPSATPSATPSKSN